MNFEKLHREEHEDSETLKPRSATRTVLFDQDGKVAILNVKNMDIIKYQGEELRKRKASKIPQLARSKKKQGVTAP